MSTKTNTDSLKESFINAAMEIIKLHKIKCESKTTNSYLDSLLKEGELLKQSVVEIFKDENGRLYASETSRVYTDSKKFENHKEKFIDCKFIKACEKI